MVPQAASLCGGYGLSRSFDVVVWQTICCCSGVLIESQTNGAE